MSRKYTKANLQEIVATQQENLNVMHDLLKIMKHQNELLNSANNKLKDKIIGVKEQLYPTGKRRNKSQ